MSKVVFLLLVLVCAFAAVAQEPNATEVRRGQGSLSAHGKDRKELGACPLKSTSVKTEISGFVARVRVRQEFENPYSEPIEAVYTFPLSQNGAVDDMTMTVGTRVIRGKIMKREAAREVYEKAKEGGQTASLLDQERPNIFTQAVANIMPGAPVIVEISYVETLKYEDGAYEFVFPMTVGPRYIPGSVVDAAKIAPPIAPDRPGHDISIEVNLNAGVPVEEIRSISHEIQQTNLSPARANVTLKTEKTIPNKDFILRYDVTGGRIQDAVLAHRDERGGFFTMILQPPDRIAAEDRTPKEIVFVLDTSGSMSGFPIEKAKEAMRLSLEGLYPDDTFNFITFAGDTEVLFEEPVPATQANLGRALAFLESRNGSGGTEMMKAIKVALDPTDSRDHLRIVCFMTDGYVGNEDEIIAEVQKHPNARVFSFGIGSSVNRYLLDKIAEAGKGEAEYVSLTDDGSKAAKKFYERVRTPLLTDLSIDWNGLPVADVYPNKLTDLFSAKPVVIHGRYTKPVSGKARLRGKVAGQEYSREIVINLPEAEASNDSLASLWARTRIDELSSEKLRAQAPSKASEFDKQIMNLGLEYRLMTSFTSFVAVEDRVVNHNGKPKTVQVPVALPEGVSHPDSPFQRMEVIASIQRAPSGGGGGGAASVVTVTGSRSSSKRRISKGVVNASGSGTGNGVGYGSGSGSGGASPPPPAAAAVTVNASTVETVTEQPRETALSTTVSTQAVQALPIARSVSSLLLLQPGSRGGRRSDSDDSFSIDGIDPASQAYSRALLIAKPEKQSSSEFGTVEVQISVDQDGFVSDAQAVSGPESLRASATQAAKLSRFLPVFEGGKPARMNGELVYKFTAGDKCEIFIRKMKLVPLTEEDKRRTRLQETMHFWVYDAVMRSARGITGPTENEIKFVRDGIASVRIQLASKTPAVIEKLKAAGFEIDTQKGTILTGRISVGKLASLAEIGEVKYISAQL